MHRTIAMTLIWFLLYISKLNFKKNFKLVFWVLSCPNFRLAVLNLLFFLCWALLQINRPYAYWRLKAWCLRGMLVLVVITVQENFDSYHFELFNFPGRWLLRPTFLSGIKPCDIIMHKVKWAVRCLNWNSQLYTNKKLSDFFP